jgi:UDP-galactopyranose mutase
LSETNKFQSLGAVSYPNENAFTRITGFKHLTMQERSGASIIFEYPESSGDPYYPIPRTDNDELYQKYRRLADNEPRVSFVGRLAEYRYYNMDKVIARGLHVAKLLLS